MEEGVTTEILDSTCVYEWTYYEEDRVLVVEFTDTMVYAFDVDPMTWSLLQSAPSKGKALNALVVQRQRGRPIG